MKLNQLTAYFLILVTPILAVAQSKRGLTDFHQLEMTSIPGAPTLSNPVLINGTNKEVTSQGHGIAAPAFYDINGDGLKDLLIGEFGSGLEFGRYMGSFVRVYPNIGTEEEPVFEGTWDYARPPFQYKVEAYGTPYSIDQFCCMAFAPQFVDLDDDGYKDIVAGHYQGEVSWFRGSEHGFIPGDVLPQAGNPRDPDRKQFIRNQTYWSYAAASFGDFTDDGLPDLIVGGLGGLRISKNIGTQVKPQFASRELLLSTQDNPLKVYDYTSEELEHLGNKGSYVAGDFKLSPTAIDWDNDGLLDLLVTNSYNHEGLPAVTFFRGLKVNNDHRFAPGIPLFTTKNGSKALPGSTPIISVIDWNNDGIQDLLIGVSVVTMNGEFSDQLSWNWEKDMDLHGAGKDPANSSGFSEKQMESYKNHVKLPPGLAIEDYMTIRHKGYVYVMIGSKPDSAPIKVQKTKKK